MKKFFIAIAAIATAAACSQNETIALDNGEAISFGNAFVENSVRAATDPSYGTVDLTQFNVYGTVTGTGNGTVNIFNGNEVLVFGLATTSSTGLMVLFTTSRLSLMVQLWSIQTVCLHLSQLSMMTIAM